jgi:hypothetical protein
MAGDKLYHGIDRIGIAGIDDNKDVKTIKVDDEGRIEINLSSNNNYKAIKTTILNGVTDFEILFTGIILCSSLSITNDNSADNSELLIKINNITNDNIVLLAGDELELENIEFTKIYLSNISGITINYRIIVAGI